MSWDSHLDSLTESGSVHRGAIVGSDGSTWVATEGFDPNGAEWVGYFTPGQAIDDIYGSGVKLSGEKYVLFRKEDDADGNLEQLLVKKGAGGAAIVKATSCFVVAQFDEGYTQPPLAEALRVRVRHSFCFSVAKFCFSAAFSLQDYLVSVGY